MTKRGMLSLKLPSLKKTLLLFLIAVITLLIALPASAATLEELERQKRAAEQQQQQSTNQANEKSSQADQYNNLVNQVSGRINSLQSQLNSTRTNISSNEKAISQTEAEIKQKEAALAENQRKQAQAIQTMYVMGRESTLESLISSNSLSEVVARDQYLSALEDSISRTIKEVKRLKKDLEDKRSSLQQRKLELSTQKDQQVAYMSSLDYEKGQKTRLLNAAVSKRDQYLAQAKKAQQEIVRISAEEYALRRRISQGQIISTGGSGYPYSAIDVPDPWGFYTRECTSYAAWYWNVRLGKPFYNVLSRGDARDWPALATAQGYSVTSTPRVGAIVSWNHGAYGHVAIIEAVHANGTVDLSEYNWIPYVYSYRQNVNPYEYAAPRYIY